MTPQKSERNLISKAGIGLRSPHFYEVLEQKPTVGFLEVHSENFFAQGGKTQKFLQDIAMHYPLSFHGVSLSLGSANEPSKQHLKRLKELVKQYNPILISEHISWSITENIYLNDLLPLPYTEEALKVLCHHIDIVQNELGRQILMENPSSYISFNVSQQMSEGDFINQMVKRTGCGLLLDINNVYVTCENMGLNSQDFLQSMPLDAVAEVHLAGHTKKVYESGYLLVDTHSKPVCSEVWALYDNLLEQLGKPVPTLIEWDLDIPPLNTLLEEAQKATQKMQRIERDFTCVA